MKTHLLLLLLLSTSLCAQTDLPDTLAVSDSLAHISTPEKDTLNVTDSLGLKQGHWIFFGSDFPNSGVGAYDILEEGFFRNGQRNGTWYRYGPNQQLKAVMRFRIDPKTKKGVRDQFYNYTYHANGRLKRKPVIGTCRTASDYYLYNENGELTEIELYDSLCNSTYKLQQIRKGELDSISVLIVDDNFSEEPPAAEEPPHNAIRFDQTGEYYVDYGHRIFQVGRFEKGELVEGRQYFFDEMMRAQRVLYYENGKLVKTAVKK